MDHATIVTGLMPGQSGLLFEQENTRTSGAFPKPHCGGKTDDPTADNAKIVYQSRPFPRQVRHAVRR
ncbi:hypothetical protein EV132_11582 [Rhizobium sullae]|uniref:DCD domain-containing protein n=1 Tax=Rhizobium sullae TaxID=50338 RepID=A0A4R3Q459_RHISU|nr:hypothetical protein EV132_11582 [Rhizobium sullae]